MASAIRFTSRLAAITAVLMFGIVGPAAATKPLEQLTLDSHYNWHHWETHHLGTPPVSTAKPLPKGLYVATVQGTFSYYSAANYVHPKWPWTILCGAPQAAPIFPSGNETGKVGFDAEFVFARPWRPRSCERSHIPFRWKNFQMSRGIVWSHPQAINLSGPPYAPSPTHTYEYAVPIWFPNHVSFRLFDTNTRDNYGSLHIAIRQATPSDCANSNYKAFGFATETQCLAEVA